MPDQAGKPWTDDIAKFRDHMKAANYVLATTLRRPHLIETIMEPTPENGNQFAGHGKAARCRVAERSSVSVTRNHRDSRYRKGNIYRHVKTAPMLQAVIDDFLKISGLDIRIQHEIDNLGWRIRSVQTRPVCSVKNNASDVGLVNAFLDRNKEYNFFQVSKISFENIVQYLYKLTSKSGAPKWL